MILAAQYEILFIKYQRISKDFAGIILKKSETFTMIQSSTIIMCVFKYSKESHQNKINSHQIKIFNFISTQNTLNCITIAFF